MNRPTESTRLCIASIIQASKATDKSAFDLAGEIKAMLVEKMAAHLTENNP